MASAIAPVPQQPTPQQMMQAQMLYGPNAGLAAQRSQYLAQALQAMQANTDNLRTPAALWTHLLADGLTQWSKNDADKQFMQAYQGDQATQLANLTKGLPGSTPEGGFVSADTLPKSDPNAPIDPGMSVPPQAAATANAVAPPAQVDPQTLALARMVYGEARGEPAAGQQAVAAVALNRAHKLGVPVDQVVAAPHQFSGYNSQTQNLPADKLAAVLGNIQGVADGSVPDPTGGADHFFNPSLAQPSWGQGPGQMIGQHKFMALGEPGPMPQGLPPQGAPLQAQAAAQQPPVQPYQVASNGATPPPPQVGNAAPAPPVGPTPAAAPSSAAGVPMQPSQPPHQLVTPQEVELAKRLYADPRTRAEGQSMLLQLQQRMVTPVDAPKDMYWDGSQGRFVPKPGTQYTQLPGASPTDAAQRDPFGQVTHTAITGLEGAIPPGYERGPNNTLVPMGAGGTQTAPAGPTPAHVQAPGKAPIPPALQKTYMDMVSELHKPNSGYGDYVNSVNAANALEANLKAAMGNGTVVDQTAVDATIRAMTGLSARQGSVTSLIDHLPWGEQLKGFVAKAIGPDGANGYITPKVLQQLRTAVHAYADGHRSLANDEYNTANGGANRMGFDLGLTLPSVTPQSDIKWLDAAPTPHPANPNAPPLSAIQAEIARRKANGTWRGH